MARVEVNGRGPYRFIIDTGANRSALSPRLLRELDLKPADDLSRQLHGVTGSAELPFVDVATLRAGTILLEPGPMPVLEGAVFGGADGILGIEGLQDARIAVDFIGDHVEIAPSAGQRAPKGYLRVQAHIRRGGLLMAEGKVGRLPVKVIIDTGAERTLGNAALRDALIAKASRRGSRLENTIVGATAETAQGVSFQIPVVRIGEARLRNLPVTFGDLHVFSVWGLDDEPALLVGMDLLGTLQRFIVDYKQQELHLQTRFVPLRGNTVYRCGPTECRSRIPVDRGS
jgi:predicted aspartyl protease